MGRMLLGLFKFLGEHYTVYVVNRRPGLPQGYTLADMADDYAAMVQDEFGGPVDVIGMSTGGSIAQVFAADHPELVNRLVLYSSAYKLGEEGQQFQRRLAELARERRWGAVSAEGLAFMFLPRRGLARQMMRPIAWLIGLLSTLFAHPPADFSDYVVTIEAEDEFDFQSRLSEIKAPTLVIGGTRDPFYTPALFRETAAGIPDARLALYEKAGHGPSGQRVARDVLAFLGQNTH
jgi:pimeloyl-ACP methyl ester carboxylesterase